MTGPASAEARPRPALWATALFGLALATFGTIQAVYVFAGEGTYRALVIPQEPPEMAIALASGGTWTASRDVLVILHRATLAYVLGDGRALPSGPDGSPFYSADEASHLADVRRVFAGARIAWGLAAIVLAALVARERRRGRASRLVRDGALAAAALVLIVAIVFAVAFEPAFLAFHYVFFPQGNFLFDPATSHLLLVYPERYWYGVTLRVGVSFVVAAGLVGLGAALLARQRSAIVAAR